ncbi:ATP-binding protein [Devosia submarina]|uniref:ATP-binding protein n=1 Tax=Devosia submarina TaxID=1173082 RepID=UPI000D3B8228|nr:HAMP domain-containing sensor histidine kinase [Devosia submarina]
MGLATIWVVLSLVAAAFVLQYLFTINVERSTREDLNAALTRVAASIVPENAKPTLSEPLPDPRYATPLGGRYWQVRALDTGDIARSRSLWDLELDALGADGEISHQIIPDGRQIIMLSRKLDIESPQATRSFLVTVGEDYDPTRALIASFTADAIKLLTLLGVLILSAAWMLLRYGLAPIKAVREAIENVRRGTHKQLEGRFPTELDPLVDEVNQLLRARDATMERARSRASDLAHGLKTPLAALYGIAEELREQGNANDAAIVQEIASEMSEKIDYQLRLATLRLRTAAQPARSSLNSATLRTITVLKKTGRGEQLHWVAELMDDCWVDVDRQDLMELVGITLENAAKWAAKRVIVRATRAGEVAQLEISDDGPGVPEHQLEELGIRGRRLDEARPGTGLGLAIAGEILEINQGQMQFRRAQIGGLCVTLCLPLAKSVSSLPSA